MELALAALQRCTKFDQRDYDAMDALKEAIKQQGEPVAWRKQYNGRWVAETVEVFNPEDALSTGWEPLYAHKGEQP